MDQDLSSMKDNKSWDKLFNSKNLYYTSELAKGNTNIPPSEWFALERAKYLGAHAIYFRKFDSRPSIPQVYIYNFSGAIKSESELAEIHKKIWTSASVPLVYIIQGTHLSILDCTQPIHINGDKEEPNYLEKQISLLDEIDVKLKEYFAELLDSGVFWEKKIKDSTFSFNNSAYKRLLTHLKSVKDEFINKFHFTPFVAQKLIVQCILIKYIEERVGEDKNNQLELKNFYNQFGGAESVCDVLRNSKYILDLFSKLNIDKFHGKIFEWSEPSEIKEIEKKKNKLYRLANFLEGDKDLFGQKELWRIFSFNYLPVELISRLYEEFLGKGDEGVVYTPPHLANFLVDECMPLTSEADKINLDFKILDPTCGSGIFLVTAFKRLVQWWRIKNNYEKPTDIETIKKLLKKNIYGIDIAKEAVHLCTFSLSLAICDMIEPALIWHKLTFDDLKEENIVNNDYFISSTSFNNVKFDLIIGNPPFSTKIQFDRNWEYKNDRCLIIPQNQIALKFLGETIAHVKEGGIQCLIMPSAGLLHNEYADKFKEVFFSLYNVVQLIDFTPLARNHVLWDYKEPATVAIFVRKERPTKSNILHLVIKRTKAASERLLFEIDDYDYHFVSRKDAVSCRYVWKVNLLGGGRLKQIIDKFFLQPSLKNYLDKNREKFDFYYGEGSGKDAGEAMLSSLDFDENGINYDNCKKKNEIKINMEDREIFHGPHLLIKLNSGENNTLKNIPIELTDKYLTFKKHISAVSVSMEKRQELASIERALKLNMSFVRFFLYTTSSELLVGRNTSFLHKEFFSVPFSKQKIKFSKIENNIIQDTLNYTQDFLRYGEKSFVLKPILKKDSNIIYDYAEIYSEILNSVCAKSNALYKFSTFGISDDFIYVHFYFTKKEIIPTEKQLSFESDELNNKSFASIFESGLHNNVSTKRVIKIVNKNSIYILKPNQLRFWLKTTAYRDADRTFSEFLKNDTTNK